MTYGDSGAQDYPERSSRAASAQIAAPSRQGNQVEITDPRDVIPAGQRAGHQQIGHPAEVVETFGQMADDRWHIGHPDSLLLSSQPRGSGTSAAFAAALSLLVS